MPISYDMRPAYCQLAGHKKKPRVDYKADKNKSVDWINVFLFVLLFVVIIMFIVT